MTDMVVRLRVSKSIKLGTEKLACWVPDGRLVEATLGECESLGGVLRMEFGSKALEATRSDPDEPWFPNSPTSDSRIWSLLSPRRTAFNFQPQNVATEAAFGTAWAPAAMRPNASVAALEAKQWTGFECSGSCR